MSHTVDVVLVTASELPKPDRDSPLLVDALAGLGVSAVVRPWDEPADWAAFPLVVSRTPWDYYAKLDPFLAWMDEVSTVTCLENPVDVLRWNAHKSYLLDLGRAGVPVVPTTLVPRGAGPAAHAAALADRTEVVIKPAVSVGARGALRASATAPGARAHLRDLTAAGDALVQPFLPAVERAGEVSLILFDGNLSHAVRKVPAAGDYRVQDVHGGSVHSHDASAEELEVADATLRAAPAATAYARIDLVGTPAGPVVMEAELIEPELFLPTDAGSPRRFAECLAKRLG